MLGIIILFCVCNFIYKRFFKKVKLQTGIEIWMGLPGGGKTTMAAYLANKHLKSGYSVYSNVPISGCRILDFDNDVLVYDISNSLVIIDEAGLLHDNRDWSRFKARYTEFYKMHRHYHLRICLFSQHFEDVDKKIKTITNKIYVVKKSRMRFFIKIKEIKPRIDISEEKQIVLNYEWVHFFIGGIKHHFMPVLWKLFDSWSHEELPQKEWETYKVTKGKTELSLKTACKRIGISLRSHLIKRKKAENVQDENINLQKENPLN